MDIGDRIRKIRKQQNRTLDDVAGKSGITKSMLSKIETGATVPAVATLSRIASSLGVEVSALVDRASGSTTVYTPAAQLESAPRVKTEKGYSFFAFGTRRFDKRMQPYLFVARKEDVAAHGLSHEGEEFVYVLAGSMKYRVGSVEYTLSEGDSLYFDAEDEHELRPITDEVRYLGVFAGREGDSRSATHNPRPSIRSG